MWCPLPVWVHTAAWQARRLLHMRAGERKGHSRGKAPLVSVCGHGPKVESACPPGCRPAVLGDPVVDALAVVGHQCAPAHKQDSMVLAILLGGVVPRKHSCRVCAVQTEQRVCSHAGRGGGVGGARGRGGGPQKQHRKRGSTHAPSRCTRHNAAFPLAKCSKLPVVHSIGCAHVACSSRHAHGSHSPHSRPAPAPSAPSQVPQVAGRLDARLRDATRVGTALACSSPAEYTFMNL